MIDNPVGRKLLGGEARFGLMAFEYSTPGPPPVLDAGGGRAAPDREPDTGRGGLP